MPTEQGERSLPRGLHLHFDCHAGAAGDMALGALLDLGVPAEAITRALDRMGIGGERLGARRRVIGGLSATDVRVDTGGAEGAETRHHHHPYRAIRARIEGAELGAAATARALDIFDRIARAEAALHGVGEDEVEFHEVGAIDSIVDVVGAAVGLAYLQPSSVTAASVAVGHGTVDTSHGLLPVPAPAALSILREAGAVVEGGGAPRELCTPTGAAILASAVTSWSPMPAMVPVAAGYGAGDAELSDRPNVMRAVLGRAGPEGREGAGREGEGPEGRDFVYRIEANLDDMRPELAEAALDSLFAAGAADVWITPVIMKSSRPGAQITAIAPEGALDSCLDALFAESTTIGARFDRVRRRVLDRRCVEVETEYGPIPIKLAYDRGDSPINAAPEYRACRDAARRAGVAVKAVLDAAIAAYHRG